MRRLILIAAVMVALGGLAVPRHGGRGAPNVATAMQGNAMLSLADPLNLVTVILNGMPVRTFLGRQRMYPMSPFANDLTADQIAELATWMRAEWGGSTESVATGLVEAVPRAID